MEVLKEGVHSGDASGIVPSSFRILRHLLDRLEDPESGQIRLPELNTDIPETRRRQAGRAAKVLGDTVHTRFPFQTGGQPVAADATERVLNRTWRPTLCVTGADGLPPLSSAGNVLRPLTAVKLSLRLPPTVESVDATEQVKTLLESHPPYGAKVRFEPEQGATGWNAPPFSPWLEQALEDASASHFGKPAMYMGEGGTIPFIGMLAQSFPEAQFLITGVLGPQSNAHGPNEFLHLPTAKRLTGCVAHVLHKHASRQGHIP